MRRSTRSSRSPSRSVAVGAPAINVQRTELASACVSSQHTSKSAAPSSTMSVIVARASLDARDALAASRSSVPLSRMNAIATCLSSPAAATDVGQRAELRRQQLRQCRAVEQRRTRVGDRHRAGVLRAAAAPTDAPRRRRRSPRRWERGGQLRRRPAPRRRSHRLRVAPSPCSPGRRPPAPDVCEPSR